MLEGIEPKLVPDVLYVTTGSMKGNVVRTLKACDYEIVFQGLQGREERLIRFRHFPDEDNEREEVIAIDGYLTDLVNEGKLLVGLTPLNAKTIV
jgi:negative regulator of sigma E activity